jgi:von Willebrand factor type A domain
MRQYTAIGLVLGSIWVVGCGSGDNGGASHASGGSGSTGKGTGGGVVVVGTGGDGSGGTSSGGSSAASGGSTSSAGGSGGNSGSSSGGSSAGGSSGSYDGGPSPGHGEPVTSVTPVDTGSSCASQALGAAAGSLDIFIMLDKSQSMSDATPNGSSKWDVITQSIDDFVNDPQSAGMEVGLGFFGVGSGSGSHNNDSSCTAADYASPVVPIAALPTNATPIANAISKESPSGNTPTEPALHGAINYAAQWAQQNPSHKVIVVFATDGLPNGCNSSVAGAATIAAGGVKGPPPILTYVIGVFGDQDCPGGVGQGQTCDVISNTNEIANSGGTQAAFIVNASGDTGAQFLQALNSIRTANAVGCDFAVPAPSGGKVVDFSSATVEYTPGGGSATSLTWVASASACDPTSGGWYYDSATAPNDMLLCDASCAAVQADPKAKLDVMVGCLPPGTNGTGGAAGTGGTGGTGGTTGTCLLDGQSCTSASACCSDICSSGVCGTVVR